MSEASAFDPATLAFYAGEAQVYANRHGSEPAPALACFLDRLRPGARILELGCGGGQDAAAMLARGFDVDATDAVPAFAAAAAARIGHSTRILRFDELEATAAYDAVWANACLLHVPRAALPAILARIHRALRPGGWHHASYKSGERERRDRFGRYYNAPDEAAVVDAYRSAGEWQTLTTSRFTGRGYDGVDSGWIAVTASRTMAATSTS